MTLNQLEQDVYRRIGANTSTIDTSTQTRIRAFLNESQQEIVSEPGMEVLLNDSVTFASVASTPEYSLPPVIARIKNVYETSNQRKLGELSLPMFRALYPSPTAITGIPMQWADLGFAAVATQPADASELFFKSDSASDDNTKKVFVEGYTTGGYFQSASVAMNGVTAVSLGATITGWIAVTKFYIGLASGATTAVSATGNIALREDSGTGTILATIPPGQVYSRYRRIALSPCPSSVLTYTVDFERDLQDMSNPTDEPVLPKRFHRLLGIGARMREYEKQDQGRYKAAQSEYLFGIKRLKHFLYEQAVGNPNLRAQRGPVPNSRLGAYFPADV